MGMGARRAIYVCLLILSLCLCGEILASAALRLLDAYRGYTAETGVPVLSPERIEELKKLLSHGAHNTVMTAFDPFLGWRLRPNFHTGIQRTNGAGMVALREYKAGPPEGVVRIAAFGESFTQCVVPNAATWEQVIEDSCRGVEVLNFGVAAYGPDQAYLRYLCEGRRYHPDIVLIGYMTENIWRVVNVFRP